MFGWRYYATTIMFSSLAYLATTLVCLVAIKSCNKKETPKPEPLAVYSVELDLEWCETPRHSKQFLIPKYENTVQILDVCEVSALAVSRSLYVFYQNWVAWFGDDTGEVRHMLNNLLIEWGDTKRTVHSAYNIHGRLIKNVRVTGLAIAPNHMWVMRGEKGIGTSSFVHELVHLALWNVYDNADPTHEGGEDNLWTKEHTEFINETKDLLFLIGDRYLADPNYNMDTLRSVMESNLRYGEVKE